ncbi:MULTISPECIES: AMP-binding protein [unclassified Sphingomonas]|uniref:AMP-binding protein n=1 Tax=unclassified Sphingomonas TaxID=196159 RepID=UPI0006FC06FF|nr:MULTISPECIES: AMP-binding protein [unclassified Sphingomonas]KQX18610.1 AMP-binding protein [Sphingomonas sp. Root1294]KQY72067.1 AMP-binding protein [Sphingomonas sp. Root50]KRB94664.1 AMP-binding protein [Sphingomonas sp. Root720]
MPTRKPQRRYEDAVATFSLQRLAAELNGDLENGLNVCIECCDRHCGNDRVALRWVSADGRQENYSFEQLRDMSARIANMLARQGIQPGDVVAGMLPRTPALLATVLGVWRLGAVYQPLFTAFGPKTVEHRFKIAETRFVVTDTANRPTLADVPNCPPMATLAAPGASAPAGDVDLRAALAEGSDKFQPVMRRAEDLFLMMGTSGTVGLPKAVPVPTKALLALITYMRDAIDLTPEDIFWNIADPGWAYGLYYAVTGPLLLGNATAFYDGAFSVESTYQVIDRLGVTNLAGSPTAFRRLIDAGPDAAAALKGRLRAVSSAGEPLNPEVIRWFEANLAVPIHDHYGQTELAMVVNNHHGLIHKVRQGSTGFAMPGFRVAVLDDEGRELGPRQPGILSIDIARSPLHWFSGYLNQETPAIAGGYYRTGDTVELGDDGTISFIGRADDVITSSGYRIGPFDVESALIEHPAVTEAAAIGVPDPQRTEIVKAFVVLSASATASPALAEKLKAHVRARLSAHAYPREIEFTAELPKTPSGKIQRNVIRNAEIARRAARGAE